MSDEIVADTTPVPTWLRGKSELYEDDEPKKKDKLPVPKFRPSGRCLICLQDPSEAKIGRIYIPPDKRKEKQPTLGTVVGVGDGYEPDEPPDLWEAWVEACPYVPGTRVLWSRYQDTVISSEVNEDWWDSPQEKERSRGKVEFVILHVKEVIGVEL